jgi:hypothetical protein
LQGTRPGKLPAPSISHGEGRVCVEPGCGTRLSRYNPAMYCWQHADVVFPNYRGKRLEPGAGKA